MTTAAAIPLFLALALTGAAVTGQSDRPVAAEAVARARLEYRARAARLTPEDVVGHFALAQWCRENHLPRCARWELHEVLREMPDHVGARGALGQVFHAGRWVDEATLMQSRGLVRFDGQWMTRYDAARARDAKERELARKHRIAGLRARLTARDPGTRAAARAEATALVETGEWPELGALLRPVPAPWAAGTGHTGLFTIRATHSRLLELRPFTTSLGVGTPVRLHLPRMETISINTTVALPLGR